MEKCKFCGAELEENSTVCPGCGKDNNPEAEPAKETVTETSEEMTADTSGEKTDAPQQGILLTPGKVAVIAAAFIALVAIIIALIISGKRETPAASPETATAAAVQTTTAPVEETEAATVPADGNPEDVTCKGSYTASDEEVKAAAQTVVATIGSLELTNEDMQVLYWSEVWQFLSQYGSYASYFGIDPTDRLDTQQSSIVQGWTWQQVFLDNAIQRWQESSALSLEAEKEGFRLDEENQSYLDSALDQLDALAAQNGIASGAELLLNKMGAGATPEAYVRYQNNQYLGYGYFSNVYNGMQADDAQVAAYFDEHAAEYEEQGLTKDTCTVDIRHILIYPEGASSDTIRTEEFSDEAWAAGEVSAQDLLNQWLAGEQTEESFAKLAEQYSGDPGSQANGGLYEGVSQGQMVEEFDAWCFDSQRKAGDTGIVKTMYGYHVMYFSGSQPLWQDTARSDLLAEMADKFVENVKSNYAMSVDYSKIVLGAVTIE